MASFPFHLLIVSLLGMVPSQLCYAFTMAHILRFESVVPFWAASIALIALSCLLGIAYGPLARITGRALLVILPLFLSNSRLSHRLLVVTVSAAILIVAGLPINLLWVLLLGMPLSYESAFGKLAYYALLSAIHLVILISLFIGFRNFILRHLGDEVQAYVGEGPRYFVGFPLLQLPFLILGIALLNESNYADGTVTVLIITGAIVCLAADLALFVSIERFVLSKTAQERADELKKRLDESLASYHKMAAGLESSARFRHDSRNHIQVMRALAEAGEYDKARMHLQQLRQAIRVIETLDDQAKGGAS